MGAIKSIFILLTCIFLTSCSPEKRLNRLLKNHPGLIHESDSIRTWITSDCYYDTVYIPYQELLFDTTGIFPDNIVFHHSEKKGHLTQVIDIKSGKISVLCNEEAYRDSVKALKETIHEKDSRKEVVTIPVMDGWYMFWRAGFWICFTFCLIFIAGIFYVK